MVGLTADEQGALRALKATLAARFGARVTDLRLFGSRARDEGHEESDLDVLIVVDGLEGGERREIGLVSGDLLTRYGVVVSALTLSAAEWARLVRRERLLAREIERDGVPV